MKAWRWLRGGHWELWWVDAPVSSDVWHRVEVCTYEKSASVGQAWWYGGRPSPLCRGTPVCESHGTRWWMRRWNDWRFKRWDPEKHKPGPPTKLWNTEAADQPDARGYLRHD